MNIDYGRLAFDKTENLNFRLNRLENKKDDVFNSIYFNYNALSGVNFEIIEDFNLLKNSSINISLSVSGACNITFFEVFIDNIFINSISQEEIIKAEEFVASSLESGKHILKIKFSGNIEKLELNIYGYNLEYKDMFTKIDSVDINNISYILKETENNLSLLKSVDGVLTDLLVNFDKSNSIAIVKLLAEEDMLLLINCNDKKECIFNFYSISQNKIIYKYLTNIFAKEISFCFVNNIGYLFHTFNNIAFVSKFLFAKNTDKLEFNSYLIKKLGCETIGYSNSIKAISKNSKIFAILNENITCKIIRTDFINNELQEKFLFKISTTMEEINANTQ